MLPTVTVDPSTIWIIDESDSEEVASRAIENALKWMQSLAAGPLKLQKSDRSLAQLADLGAFPSEPRLRELIAGLGLSGVVTAKSLAENLSRFLANIGSVEVETGISDALFHGTTVDPDLTLEIAANNLRATSVDAMGLAAICANEDNRHSVYAFPRQSSSHRNIKVSTSIDIVEYSSGPPKTEEKIVTELRVLSSPEAWRHQLSASKIWESADNATDLEVAIWLEASELERVVGGGLWEFRVGTAFFETLHACGAANDGPYAAATLTKCAQILLRQSHLRPQPFREGAKTTSPTRQRQRDHAKAWRQHVTKHHQALRLMYWVTNEGLIEFATLANKKDTSIDEGNKLSDRTWLPGE